ncbi:Small nuclear RNA activating complex (SNAPc), subunit SNAP43 [Carex littledalei]|uniref:Small nuclear RNA activating complex (SNAPc), subunit SNAP43 n=1 Tax=Carex littledalei TaxID=544730 RepID=A0A833R9K6_9POAL|nr:Small nuclear RNA activating complex (SNAPc), subunit SNAP43 [Carex littledalei]
MDLKPFKLDIDELLDEFTQGNCLTLADLKRIWMERKFSYIFEARPIKNSSYFMQSLYTHCIGHMISAGPLSRRLGALYCLYCLHEIQPYRPGFKIYLSLGELRKLRNLIGEAKQNKIRVVPALVKRMLEKNMFLYGFVDMLGNTTQQRVDDITMQQQRRVEVAYDKLFADSNIERYLHMSLGADLELGNYKKMLSEYEQAKAIAIQEASETTDIADVKHIIENKKTTGDVMDEIVNKWDAQKDEYYEKTGITRPDQIVAADDDFQKELENFLEE